MSRKFRSNWKIILNAVTFIGLFAIIYVARHQIIDSIHAARGIRWWLLLLIPVWQALNYHCYAKAYQEMFSILGTRLKYRFLYKISLELNCVNLILPSGGVSGFSYFGLRLKDKKISGAQATLVQLMRFILLFISFQFVLFFALIILSFSGRVNRLVLLSAGSLSTLIAVGTLIVGYIIGSRERIHAFFGFITRVLNRLIHIFRRKHPETINIAHAQDAFEALNNNYSVFRSNLWALKSPFLWLLGANMTEMVTLYTVYVAFGHWVNPGAVILAYAVANFAGFISVLPAGVGVYETLMTAILAVGGIEPAVSLPVTVMYRIFSMITQIAPGYYLYHKHLSGGDDPNEDVIEEMSDRPGKQIGKKT